MKHRIFAVVPALTLVIASLGAQVSRADSPARTQWVLAVAKANGQGGEAFVSSLRIVNPNAVTANVGLTYLPQSTIDGNGAALGDNSARTAVNVTVGAGQTLAIEDIVGTRFASAAIAGGIRVESDIPVSVLSRTFVANARSATGVPGTFGFSIPAQVEAQAVGLGDTAFIPYISAAPTSTAGFRSNFIMLNIAQARNQLQVLEPVPSVLHVKLVKGDGATVGERDYTLGRFSAAQQGNIAASFGYTAEDTNLTIVATVKSGGPVVIGTSIIDNAISSLNYAPPTKAALPDGRIGLVFPNDAYDLSGRLDIQDGVPIYLSATIALDTCVGGATIAYILQGFAEPPQPNTTFTKNADGTYAILGSTAEATWSGTIHYELDGSVSGTLTYARTVASGGPCAGISKSLIFAGAQVTKLP